MRQLKFTAVALLGFIIGAIGVNAALQKFLPLVQRDFPEVKLAFAVREKPEVVFFGASHVEMGLNPGVFDAEVAALGHPLRSYNFGFGGMSAVEMGYHVRRLVEQSPSVKYVVLSPCFQCLNAIRRSNNIRSIDFFNISNALEMIRYLAANDELPNPQLPMSEYVGNVVKATIRHYTSFGLGASALNWVQMDAPEPDFTKAEWWADRGPRGYALTDLTMNRDELEKYVANVTRVPPLRVERLAALNGSQREGIRDLVTNASFNFFLEIIKDLNKHGVAALVIQPPSFWDWQTEVAFIASYRAHCQNQPPLIDFGDLNAHPSLFTPAAIRFDDTHMNTRGANIWSKELAQRFVQLIDSGAFQKRSACIQR